MVGTEPLDDRIERGGDRRERAELFDHRVARRHGAAAQHRVAVLVDHRFGTRIAVLVDEDRHQPDREALGEVIDHIFARAEIDLEMLALLVGKIGKTPVEHGLGGRDQLDDDRVVVFQHVLDCRPEAGKFHREEQLGKESLLGAFEHRQRRYLGAAVERVAAVAIHNPCRLERFLQVGMDDCPGLSIGIVDRDLL